MLTRHTGIASRGAGAVAAGITAGTIAVHSKPFRLLAHIRRRKSRLLPDFQYSRHGQHCGITRSSFQSSCSL